MGIVVKELLSLVTLWFYQFSLWQDNHAFEWNEGKSYNQKHYMENKKIAEKKEGKTRHYMATLWQWP